ncbi:nudix domain-containing protein [Pestalotiopsis sp. NC0098]|nr:nudix domain-containing protein [Pestalotiopsis sp. NC0098]
MSTTPAPHPRVGVAAVIRNASGQLVVGKRLSSHGKGTVQFPGGHLEYGEEFFACAERETLEETGLRVKAVRLVAVTNSVFVEDCKHYITLFVLCEMLDPEATPQILEPEKCESWSWVSWDTICEWVDHHDDHSDTRWADKKCFLPILHLVKENRNVNLEP